MENCTGKFVPLTTEALQRGDSDSMEVPAARWLKPGLQRAAGGCWQQHPCRRTGERQAASPFHPCNHLVL